MHRKERAVRLRIFQVVADPTTVEITQKSPLDSVLYPSKTRINQDNSIYVIVTRQAASKTLRHVETEQDEFRNLLTFDISSFLWKYEGIL